MSRERQRVTLRDLDLEVEFEEGEAIHTENSYKYSPAMLQEISGGAGFGIDRSWLDEQRRFSLSLLRAL